MEIEDMLKCPPLIQDVHDHRDWIAGDTEFPLITQKGCSITPYALKALTQEYGSCAAFAATQMVFIITRQLPGIPGIIISPFDLYWRTRERMGTIPEDSGSQMRATMRALTNPGVLPWHEFPGIQHPSTRPPETESSRIRMPGYIRIPVNDTTWGHLRHCIYFMRTPVMVGLRIPERLMYGSFGKDGILEFPPDIKDDEPTYSHCMLVTGWAGALHFEVLNSWGVGWGNRGKGLVHRDWFSNPKSCVDIWTVYLKSTDRHGYL